jgi:hypothetical protein
LKLRDFCWKKSIGARHNQHAADAMNRKIIDPAADIHPNNVMNNSYKENSLLRGIHRELFIKFGTSRLSLMREIPTAMQCKNRATTKGSITEVERNFFNGCQRAIMDTTMNTKNAAKNPNVVDQNCPGTSDELLCIAKSILLSINTRLPLSLRA